MKIGIPYRKIGEMAKTYEKTGIREFLHAAVSTGSIIILPIAFLLGRASLIGGLMPFGIAFYVSTSGLEINRLLVAACVISGMTTVGANEQVYVSAAALLLFQVFSRPFKNTGSRLMLINAMIIFAAMLIPQIVTVSMKGFLLYDLLQAFFNSIVVFLSVFIFKNAVFVICGGFKKSVISTEEMISVSVLAALALSGLSNIQFFGFSIRNTMCILMILLFSYRYGSAVGAATGVTAGLIVNMSTASVPFVIGSYAFCGLLGGIFKNLGKIGTCLGFVVGNTMLSFYLNGSTDMAIYIKEILLAVLLFMLIPQKLVESVAGNLYKGMELHSYQDKKSYSMRIRELTVRKLNKFSKALKELSDAFGEASNTNTADIKQDISVLFDRVADRVCKSCSLCLHCWDRNFYNTYQAMFKIVEKLDTRGRVEETDIPKYFLDRCERINEFTEAVNNIYEIFKVNLIWKSRMGESRELVSRQFDGMSRAISSLAGEINTNVQFKSELEDMITTKLVNAGIKVNETAAFENKCGKYEISILHKGCKGRRNCISIIEKLVSDVTGRKMVKENDGCLYSSGNGTCVLRMVEKEAFKVTCGIAGIPKYGGDVSGDSHAFMNTGSGRYFIALSDGMGSGKKALARSNATVGMIEQFLESGFDKETTVKLINSILVLKPGNDSFATIDLSILDLHTGIVEFVKVGAAPAFVKKEQRVECVRSVSLPAGLLGDIETELAQKKMDAGDFIIMMTDGITESFNQDEKGYELLQKYIQDIESTNPQEVADSILGMAFENCRGKPLDDMLVIAAKVWKSAS